MPTKLDPYKAIVRERLEEYPELTAVRLLAEESRPCVTRINDRCGAALRNDSRRPQGFLRVRRS